MRLSLFGMILFLITCAVQAQEPTLNGVESISPAEYLKLPEGPQALYVGGVIDGVSHTTYGYSIRGHDEYVRCVRTLTLGALAQKVASWLRANPTYRESMPGAVAKTLGSYCKPLRGK
jgi:hypothetical protein